MRLREFVKYAEDTFHESDIKKIYEIFENNQWTEINFENKNNNPGLIFQKSEIYDETLSQHPNLRNKMEDFLRLKQQNFSDPFGSSDKLFVTAGFYAKAVPGLKHAHLNRDVSIVYRIHGSSPRVCDLYGLFTHKDLGTGEPPNIRKQKNQATSFSNLSFKE
jgi:hypothetical protein